MKELRVCNSVASCNKKKKKSHIHCLPEEIIIYILVRLRADDLHDSVRLVCRKWYDIINTRMFIREHLLHSGRGFLLQSEVDDMTRLAEFGESVANVIDTRLPKKCDVFASCDGLVVVRVEEKFYVANLVTKETVSLPPVNAPLRKSLRYSVSLIRSGGGSEMDYDYRVVFSHLGEDDRDLQCMFITVGKDDAWKAISCCGDLAHWYKVRRFAAVLTKGVGGMVYWVIDGKSHIYALGNDMETMHELPNPILNYKSCRSGIVGGIETLSIVVSLREEVFDMWFLSHSGSCFEWRKEKRIDLSAKSPQLSRPGNPNPLDGVALLKNGQVVVFKDHIGRFVYHNVETCETFKFGSILICSRGYFAEFAYSLVRLSCS